MVAVLAALAADGQVKPDMVLKAISPKLSISRYLLDGWLDGPLD